MFHKKMSCLSWLYLSVLVVILDFITKTWMSVWLNGWGIVHVFPYLNLILAHNSGSAFSFLAWADGWQRWLFATISLGVSVYLVYLLYRGGDQSLVGLCHCLNYRWCTGESLRSLDLRLGR